MLGEIEEPTGAIWVGRREGDGQGLFRRGCRWMKGCREGFVSARARRG